MFLELTKNPHLAFLFEATQYPYLVFLFGLVQMAGLLDYAWAYTYRNKVRDSVFIMKGWLSYMHNKEPASLRKIDWSRGVSTIGENFPKSYEVTMLQRTQKKIDIISYYAIVTTIVDVIFCLHPNLAALIGLVVWTLASFAYLAGFLVDDHIEPFIFGDKRTEASRPTMKQCMRIYNHFRQSSR
jgi:hypothetical protein